MFWERAKIINIEIKDVRSLVGSEIEDTKDNLKRNWFLFPKVLYINCYKNIKYKNVYKINLKNYEKYKVDKKTISKKIRPKEIYGLPLLKGIFQFLCRKNMNLDWLQLQKL